MKNKKLLTVILISVMIIISAMILSACSGQTGGKAFSQTISGEEPRIWFECQNKIEESEPESTADYIFEDTEEPESAAASFGRETRVIWIKVFKDGKLSSYSCLDNVNLGHFSKMTDEEILKELETETYLCGQKDQPYEIYLYTDAAGQEVVFEGVPSLIRQESDADPMYFMALMSKDPMPAFQVYDSYYGGYVLYNYDEGMLKESCCVTRCAKGESFALDNMDLENAVLDYKTPEEMLHEKNAEIKKSDQSSKKTETKESEETNTEG